MTLDEALRVADNGKPMLWSDIDPLRESVTVLAAEVRRLQSEVTALRLYAPAQRAGAMQPPVQIAPTRWPFWRNETDEEFKARGNVHIAVVV